MQMNRTHCHRIIFRDREECERAVNTNFDPIKAIIRWLNCENVYDVIMKIPIVIIL